MPLVLEYEAMLYRELPNLLVSKAVVDAVLDYHCAVARHHAIFFLWRPFLSDPSDDMVLELAIKAQGRYIVTFNQRHFRNIQQFGLQAVTPGEFLGRIGVVA